MIKVFNLLSAAALTLAALAAAPAQALGFDAFSSFDGTQGADNFTYGTFTGGFDASGSFTLFDNNTNCAFAGSVCLNDSNPALVPQASKSTSTSFQYGTVDVPDDRLVLHTGENEAVFVRFTSPIAAEYFLGSLFSVQDRLPTGVGITLFVDIVGDQTYYQSVGALAAPGDTFGYNEYGYLAVGDSVGFILDNAGNYFNDSVGVSLSLTVVPEPATWAMMLAGFGLVGAAARRRRSALA